MILRLVTSLWVLLLIGAGLFIYQLPWGEKLSTSVGDLLPEGSRAEGIIVRDWVQSRQSRMVWATLQPGPRADNTAIQAFEEYLTGKSPIASVYRLDTTGWIEEHSGFWWQQRFALRFPHWWSEMTAEYGKDPKDLAAGAVSRLEMFLEQPDSLAWESLLQGDPLLLIPEGVDAFDRVLSGQQDYAQKDPVIPWMLELKGDPLETTTQEDFLQAMKEVSHKLIEILPDAVWEYSGVVRFAEANRSGITREVAWLNIAIAGSVLLIMAVFVKSLKPLLVVAVVIIGSLLCGILVVMQVFQQVHILALVMGSILAGIAADYAFHTAIGSHTLKNVLFPLLVGFFTTATGYSLFLFAPLPMLQQTGLFVSAGLAGALVTAVLLRCWLKPEVIRWRIVAGFSGFSTSGIGGKELTLGGVAFLAIIFGIAFMRVSWIDDLRLLEKPTPELYRIDTEVRQKIVGADDAQLIIVTGSDWRDARKNLNLFLKNFPDENEFGARIWEWVPDPDVLIELADWLRQNGGGFGEAMMVELENRHFDSRAFQPFVTDWTDWLETVQIPGYWDQQVTMLGEVLPGPLSALFSPGKNDGPAWFGVSLAKEVEMQDRLLELPGVIAFSQLSQLNQLFAGYREAVLKLAMGAAALIAVILMLILPFRFALMVVFIPCAAVGCYLVLGSFFRGHFNLFDLIGIFLGACLALDYALFSASAIRKNEGIPSSIHLSALTTSVSFLWLNASSVPAVQHLGQSVALSVLFAWLITVVTSRIMFNPTYQK